MKKAILVGFVFLMSTYAVAQNLATPNTSNNSYATTNKPIERPIAFIGKLEGIGANIPTEVDCFSNSASCQAMKKKIEIERGYKRYVFEVVTPITASAILPAKIAVIDKGSETPEQFNVGSTYKVSGLTTLKKTIYAVFVLNAKEQIVPIIKAQK